MFLGCLLSDLGGAQPGARESRPPQPSAQRRGHRPGHRTSSRFQVSHCAAARTPRGSWDLDTLFHPVGSEGQKVWALRLLALPSSSFRAFTVMHC